MSVYTSVEFSERANYPHYQLVRHWAKKTTSPGKVILDLGSSDLPATHSLELEYKVIGLDLNRSALDLARNRGAIASLVQADLSKLPFKTNDQVSTIILGDVIEHFDHNQAQTILRGLAETFPGVRAILVTMPIVSLSTVPTWRELMGVVKHGCRPETGLFDRTHQILTDQNKQRELFESSGFGIVHDKTITWHPGVTTSFGNQLTRFIIERLIPRMVQPFGTLEQRRGVTEKITAYQGFYVLSPTI